MNMLTISSNGNCGLNIEKFSDREKDPVTRYLFHKMKYIFQSQSGETEMKFSVDNKNYFQCHNINNFRLRARSHLFNSNRNGGFIFKNGKFITPGLYSKMIDISIFGNQKFKIKDISNNRNIAFKRTMRNPYGRDMSLFMDYTTFFSYNRVSNPLQTMIYAPSKGLTPYLSTRPLFP